jgi:hypothetical protein
MEPTCKALKLALHSFSAQKENSESYYHNGPHAHNVAIALLLW